VASVVAVTSAAVAAVVVVANKDKSTNEYSLPTFLLLGPHQLYSDTSITLRGIDLKPKSTITEEMNIDNSIFRHLFDISIMEFILSFIKTSMFEYSMLVSYRYHLDRLVSLGFRNTRDMTEC
jgi:hypothetical protein